MANKAVAIDLGSHGGRAIAVKATKHGLAVTRFVSAPAAEAADVLRSSGLSLQGVICGLAGRDMTLRYSQVPPTPDWQLKNLMDLEIQDLAAQSGGALSADYNLLPTQDPEAGVDTVLLALAKDEALQRLQQLAKEAGGTCGGFVPNCVALYNAYLKCGPVEPDTVVCLANIGHETIDIALVKGQDLLFARNLSGGGKVLDDAIAAAFNVSARKAESLKHELLDLDPQSRGRFASGQAEKVTMAAGGAAQAITAGIQSSLAFCKAQTKIADLRLDKVLLCGGGARLRGIRNLLREALRCPVETFDPFANLDLSALPAEEARQLEGGRAEAAVALGLAAGAVDDSLYSLVILPEAVKKRQRFVQRTVFDLAAVAVALLLLVLSTQRAKRDVEDATRVLGKVQRDKRAAKDVNAETEKQLDSNKQQRALVDVLREQALPLHGALRTLRAIYQHLPPELWLQKLEVAAKSNSSKKSLVTFVGAGKELGGVDVNSQSQKFSIEFKADPLLRGAEASRTEPAHTGNTTNFTFTVDYMAAAAADPGGKGTAGDPGKDPGKGPGKNGAGRPGAGKGGQ